MGFPMGQKGRDKRHGSRKRRIPVTHYAAVRIFFSSRSPVCQVFVSTQHHYSNNCVESLLQPYIQPTILKFENFFFFFYCAPYDLQAGVSDQPHMDSRDDLTVVE